MIATSNSAAHTQQFHVRLLGQNVFLMVGDTIERFNRRSAERWESASQIKDRSDALAFADMVNMNPEKYRIVRPI